MRKIIFILIVCCIAQLSMKAQSKLSLGVKVGANLSSAGGDYSDIKSRLGYHVGLIADYNFSNSLFLRTGLDFTTKGAKFDKEWLGTLDLIESVDPVLNTYSGYKKDKYRLNYLQLPISLGYRFPLSKSVNLTANAGVYFAYGVYAREKVDNGYIDKECGLYYRGKYKGFDDIGMHKFDFGLIGGVGVEYNRYLLSVNYEAGLYNTMSGKYVGSDPSWKNRNWTLSLGYKF